MPGFRSAGHIYKSLKIIFAKLSIVLEMLNILAANISRFTVPSVGNALHAYCFTVLFHAYIVEVTEFCTF